MHGQSPAYIRDGAGVGELALGTELMMFTSPYVAVLRIFEKLEFLAIAKILIIKFWFKVTLLRTHLHKVD